MKKDKNENSRSNFKHKCNMCTIIDENCIFCSNKIIKFLKCLFYPLKIFFKYPLKIFERPYSFMMIINYILIIPSLLLNTYIIKKCLDFKLIKSNSFFVLIFIVYFINIFNYYFTFHIYQKYEKHKLEDNKFFYKSPIDLIRYVLCYLFKENKIGFVVLFYIFQLICLPILLYNKDSIYSCKNNKYDNILNNNFILIKNTHFIQLILSSFYFQIYSMLSFLTLHFIVYFYLIITLLCKFNKSCFFMVIINLIFKSRNLNNNTTKVVYKGKEETNIDSFTNIYCIDETLKCYKYFNLYDFDKEFLNNCKELNNQTD